MCGVIGVRLFNPTDEQFDTITKLFLESKIRGLHATGIAWLSPSGLIFEKDSLPANEFLPRIQLKERRMYDNFENSRLTLIGHTRYSTSDLRYNMPLGDWQGGIVHNGIVSQEMPEHWENLYGFKCETANDSELLFRASRAGEEPLNKFPDSSIAAVEITNGQLTFYRNNKRPLYYKEFPNGILVFSTRDIGLRAGIKSPVACEPYVKYTFNEELKCTALEQN